MQWRDDKVDAWANQTLHFLHISFLKTLAPQHHGHQEGLRCTPAPQMAFFIHGREKFCFDHDNKINFRCLLQVEASINSAQAVFQNSTKCCAIELNWVPLPRRQRYFTPNRLQEDGNFSRYGVRTLIGRWLCPAFNFLSVWKTYPHVLPTRCNIPGVFFVPLRLTDIQIPRNARNSSHSAPSRVFEPSSHDCC